MAALGQRGVGCCSFLLFSRQWWRHRKQGAFGVGVVGQGWVHGGQ